MPTQTKPTPCSIPRRKLREFENIAINTPLPQGGVFDVFAAMVEQELLNTPELNDFARGTVLEALHARGRWGVEHDAGKTHEDWFWLVGYLAGKAMHAAKAGDIDKLKHHCISTAAALANWHAQASGTPAAQAIRPGIEPPPEATVPWPTVTQYTGGADPDGTMSRVWLKVDDTGETVEYVRAKTEPAPPDNWQQYAKDRETAQACIERHRREQDTLLKLLAKERESMLNMLAAKVRTVQVPDPLTPDHQYAIKCMDIWAKVRGLPTYTELLEKVK